MLIKISFKTLTLGENVQNTMFITNSGMDQGKDKRSSLLSFKTLILGVNVPNTMFIANSGVHNGRTNTLAY
jgi:hypothetical protein